MASILRPPELVSAIDRRGALRHPVEVEGALSVCSGSSRTVFLTDISESGCQIVRPADLTRDTTISLGFGGFNPMDAVVAWTSPTAAGLQFDQPVHHALVAHVVAAAKGRRRTKRLLAPDLVRREERMRLWHLHLAVSCQIGTPQGSRSNTFAATLSDLSSEGCRIVAEVDVSDGSVLLVTVAERWPLLGIVRWSGDRSIGVEFCDKLAPGTVESIARCQEHRSAA